MDQTDRRSERAARVDGLLREVFSGAWKKDHLPNASLSLTEEAQAAYFSQARNNMKMEIAHWIMEQQQQLDDCEILGVLKYNGEL